MSNIFPGDSFSTDPRSGQSYIQSSLQGFSWPPRDTNSVPSFTQPFGAIHAPAAPPFADQYSAAPQHAASSSFAAAGVAYSLQGMRHLAPLNQTRLWEASFPPHDPDGEDSAAPANQPQHGEYTDADWDRHKEKIRRLYILENKPANETKAIMHSEDGFNPSLSMYKRKFKQWNWSKHLPAQAAFFMAEKFEERRREEKPTIFSYGGQQWTEERVQQSVQRPRVQQNERLSENVYRSPTMLQAIKWWTPSPAVSPLDRRRTSPIIDPVVSGRWTPRLPPHTPQAAHLELVWHGLNRGSINTLVEEAEEFFRSRNHGAAETKFREALAASERLLSATHEDTVKLAYQLADFYAQLDRPIEADRVLNWMSQKFVGRWGLMHDNSVRHNLHVAELYQKWSRGEDANALLYRLVDSYGSQPQLPLDSSGLTLPPMRTSPAERLNNLGAAVVARRPLFSHTDNPSIMDYQLRLASSQVESNDGGAESLLLGLVTQCENVGNKLARQRLQAWCLLIEFHWHRQSEPQLAGALAAAKDALEHILKSQKANTESLFEGCIDVAKKHLEHGRAENAESILETIYTAADMAFAKKREVAIRVLIRIGKMYELLDQWSNASLWYQHALSESMAVNGVDHSLTAQLEEALDMETFSYTL